MPKSLNEPDTGRRSFVKRTLYVPPAVLTLAAAPAFAKPGSQKHAPGKPGKWRAPKHREHLAHRVHSHLHVKPFRDR